MLWGSTAWQVSASENYRLCLSWLLRLWGGTAAADPQPRQGFVPASKTSALCIPGMACKEWNLTSAAISGILIYAMPLGLLQHNGAACVQLSAAECLRNML